MKTSHYKTKSSHREISELWMECCKRDIQNDPLIQTALQQLRINPFDEKCLKIVHQRINAIDARETLQPEPFRKTNPSKQNRISGLHRLGIVKHTEAIWGIDSNMLTTHMAIVGRTGGGKTTVIKKIIRQLLEERK